MSNATKRPKSAKIIFHKVSKILENNHTILGEDSYRGSGGPGIFLENLLGIKDNNRDVPDIEDWEIKFNGGTSLITLFHKEPEPRGIINQLVNKYGWEDGKGRISFRHTIAGCSARGFYIKNLDDRVIIRHKDEDSIVPHWKHDTLMCSAGSKLRRLILVTGKMEMNPRRVTYSSAVAFWDFRMSSFVEAIQQGIIKVDFDARTQRGPGSSIRNHGTKFRIKPTDLSNFYDSSERIG